MDAWRSPLWMIWIACLFGCADLTPKTASCDAERRCGFDAATVCGVDGQIYPCDAYASCLGLDVDPSGEACTTACQDPSPCLNVRCPDAMRPVSARVDGCNVCTCSPEVDCPAIACGADCEHGFVVDENGCQTCQCNEPPVCSGVSCTLHCEYGYEVDSDGCEICSCLPEPVCPRLACDAVECPFGYVIDEMGCETCECIDRPTDCAPPIELFINTCRNGWLTDNQGCMTGECFEPCAEIPDCDLACPSNLGRRHSELGCALCECREPCYAEQCELACEFGERVDENGCGLCQCNEAPCLEHSDCPNGSICSNPERCDGTNCFGECTAKPRCITDDQCTSDEACVVIESDSCCLPGTNCGTPCESVCLRRLPPGAHD